MKIEPFLRKSNNLFLLFRYLDYRYVFQTLLLLFLNAFYYVCSIFSAKPLFVKLFRDKSIVIALKKTKFAVGIIPGDLGFIFEVFIG